MKIEQTAGKAGLFTRAWWKSLGNLFKSRAAIEAEERAAVLAERVAQKEAARVALEVVTRDLEAARASETHAKEALKIVEEEFLKHVEKNPHAMSDATRFQYIDPETRTIILQKARLTLLVKETVTRTRQVQEAEAVARAAYEAAEAALRGAGQAGGGPYR